MRLGKTLMAAVVLLAAAGVARAQTIRGVIADGADQPVSGVVVFMLDSTSTVVARALSNERGEFRVVGPRAGTYRLRTMRIGYRPTTSEGMVALLGGEVEKRVTLSGAQVALDTVRVVDRNSCRVMSDSAAAATFSVLEQARTALAAAQLTLGVRSISATTTAYDRQLDAEGRRVIQQFARTTTAYVTQPWRAITPDSAHRAGFVSVANDNTTTYFAPSIDILQSNVFVEDHCFRLVTDKKQPTSVGVAFDPSPERRKLPEIKGTLWMDKRTAELQRLDYRYVNISSEQEGAGAGGDVAFARLTNGGWVISRWNIRMPVLEQIIRTQALSRRRMQSVAAIQVVGGEVTLATRTTGNVVDTAWSSRVDVEWYRCRLGARTDDCECARRSHRRKRRRNDGRARPLLDLERSARDLCRRDGDTGAVRDWCGESVDDRVRGFECLLRDQGAESRAARSVALRGTGAHII